MEQRVAGFFMRAAGDCHLSPSQTTFLHFRRRVVNIEGLRFAEDARLAWARHCACSVVSAE
jgi:hypothetical protein